MRKKITERKWQERGKIGERDEKVDIHKSTQGECVWGVRERDGES